MAGSLNAPPSALALLGEYEYLFASITNVSNFVSVKLTGSRNYLLWKAQMLCLLDTHNMRGIVDSTSVSPTDSSTVTMRQYDSLVKGWIFGSVTEEVLADVFNLGSAGSVWEKLKFTYDPAMCLQQDSDLGKPDAQTEIEDIDANPAETNISVITDATSIEMLGEDIFPAGNRKTMLEKNQEKCEELLKHVLHEDTIRGDWLRVESTLKHHNEFVTKAISSDGSNILHIAVGIGHNDIVRNLLLSYINKDHVLDGRNSDGSTALHIAAIVGNKYAADLLVKKNSKLLQTPDHQGQQPLHKACENMHLDITAYLLKSVTGIGTSLTDRSLLDVQTGVDLLANAISAKKYNLASDFVKNFPNYASENDDVLMAIAKTFPPELNLAESLVYPPSLDDLWEMITSVAEELWYSITLWMVYVDDFQDDLQRILVFRVFSITIVVLILTARLVLLLIFFLILIIFYVFLLIYHPLWKAASIPAFSPITYIENKKKEWEDAEKILVSVCDEIDKLTSSGIQHTHYTRPILEAACQNAYRVVDEILLRSPEAIQSTNESGYDIIQVAILHRSEKIYNLIYDMGERRNLYRTLVDSSKNNILHLAGRLAPSRELNYITGAALQLQRELQWFEEVKKLVFPTYITEENINKQTPDVVFTLEHEKLLKEGEQWMKTTAESCSITAALITTIVFAAAITVPGGSNQEKGTPLFLKEIAFTVFVTSDAISLFASSTSLLVFLSILTTRFSEKDFLVSLPRRLLIGLFTLFLSITAMMVAFGATLFLVFGEKKQWMLAPICGLAFIPIVFFATLQFPLMFDLYKSTYIRTFGKKRRTSKRRFNPNDIRLLFRK